MTRSNVELVENSQIPNARLPNCSRSRSLGSGMKPSRRSVVFAGLIMRAFLCPVQWTPQKNELKTHEKYCPLFFDRRYAINLNVKRARPCNDHEQHTQVVALRD